MQISAYDLISGTGEKQTAYAPGEGGTVGARETEKTSSRLIDLAALLCCIFCGRSSVKGIFERENLLIQSQN